jgi:cytochrome c556
MTTRLTSALAGVALALASAASAAADPEEVIKYRQGSMKALGGHMTALAQMVRGKVDYPARIEGHAQALAALSRDIPALFPEGTDFGETDARSEVWKDRARFEKVAADADKAAAGLVAAVKAADKAAIGQAFQTVGDACKACHEDFREKK